MRYHPEGEDAEKIKEKVLMRLGKELGDRSNVVMTRLNDDDLKQIDALVEVEAFKSRSEAAAFFIKEGMQARKDLFQKIMPTAEKIRDLKKQAKKSLTKEETQ
jgi:Arc/MetJ-type ribon-helix-helix transcriptional regulator